MKKFRVIGLVLATSISLVNASDIYLSSAIKPDLRSKIEKDLKIVENFNFNIKPNDQILKVMGISTLNGQSASEWLNTRVNYVVSENALSLFNLLIKRVIFVDQKNVDYPNAKIIPYSEEKLVQQISAETDKATNAENSFTVMSNIGAALYMGGKNERQIYGMKISRGLFKKAEKVLITSPRAGIIQIGEGLFSNELAVNVEDPNALANSIFRLGTFFHEARHSDGNGKSLGFGHANCPAGHDYAGQPACDENLNGPYTVGALMMAEMAKGRGENCSLKDKETLKLIILDSASRILKTTHKGEQAQDWDSTAESL